MKFRPEKEHLPESEEERLASEIRALARQAGPERPDPLPESYWQNQIVRVNERIDRAVSPLALSISWAWRVAIPGVVAVLSFVIALHYYAPVRESAGDGVRAAVMALPDQEIDSLLAVAAVHEDPAQAPEAGESAFDVSGEQIADYLIENGKATLLVESLDEGQANAMLDALARR